MHLRSLWNSCMSPRPRAGRRKGKETVTLPSLDLPISRTGMVLYYPPLFRVSAEPGTFRMEQYQAPVSAALAPTSEEAVGANAPAGQPTQEFDALKQAAKAQSNDDKEKKDATQALLDSFRSKSLGGKVTGILPVNVDFPAFGPSIYLVSELTSENQSPSAEFNFQRDKKGGAR